MSHVQEAAKSVEKAKWKLNDPCSAFCKEMDKEANCIIYQLHPSKKDIVKVKFVGTEIVEVKNTSEIGAPLSKGEDTVDSRPVSNGIAEVTEPKKMLVEAPTVNGVIETNGLATADKSIDSDTSTSTQCESDASTVVEVAPLTKTVAKEEPIEPTDPNNNADRVVDSPVLEATRILAEQLEADKVIKELREQLILNQSRLKMAHDRNEVNEIIFREIRLANSQLQHENERLRQNEQKYHETQVTLMADIKTLLSKVCKLFQEFYLSSHLFMLY